MKKPTAFEMPLAIVRDEIRTASGVLRMLRCSAVSDCLTVSIDAEAFEVAVELISQALEDADTAADECQELLAT